ncbi:transposase [Streptomyces sp. NPDC001530]|uniref:transposase n=1 Tax=Streptomyces sp. NPDC001530 TaxID=3364582 RepID=UPI0036764542
MSPCARAVAGLRGPVRRPLLQPGAAAGFPRERNKTITCLAGAEPVTGAGMPGVQRLQFFLSESPWEAEQVNDRRLELLREQPATALHDGGVIVIDDSGDRKDGMATEHVGRQWLGRYGKTDKGIVTVTTVWTDGRMYYPLHATPYTPAHHFARGRSDPDPGPTDDDAAQDATPSASAALLEKAVNAPVDQPLSLTLRELIDAWPAGRMSTVLAQIEDGLKDQGLTASPLITVADLDSTIKLLRTGAEPGPDQPRLTTDDVPDEEAEQEPLTYRVNHLSTATGGVTALSPGDSLNKAITVMTRLHERGYAFVHDSQHTISGIITTADLTDQFGARVEPFVLLEELEQRLRRLLHQAVDNGRLTLEQIRSTLRPHRKKKVKSPDDLTLGEYAYVLAPKVHWKALNCGADQQTVRDSLTDCAKFRNELMHFDPTPTQDRDLAPDQAALKVLRALHPIA